MEPMKKPSLAKRPSLSSNKSNSSSAVKSASSGGTKKASLVKKQSSVDKVGPATVGIELSADNHPPLRIMASASCEAQTLAND